MNRIVSWLHFGDLHVAGRDEQNYMDFLTLITESNRHLTSGVDFALLPGDNADDGEEGEYELVQQAVTRCLLPVHAIPGDHDGVAGSLDLFRQYLSLSVYRSFLLNGYHFVLLNSVAEWSPPEFGLGTEQIEWLRKTTWRLQPQTGCPACCSCMRIQVSTAPMQKRSVPSSKSIGL
jgi:Icc protein